MQEQQARALAAEIVRLQNLTTHTYVQDLETQVDELTVELEEADQDIEKDKEEMENYRAFNNVLLTQVCHVQQQKNNAVKELADVQQQLWDVTREKDRFPDTLKIHTRREEISRKVRREKEKLTPWSWQKRRQQAARRRSEREQLCHKAFWELAAR